MTRDEIIKLAIDAGLYSGNPRTPGTEAVIVKRLQRFAAIVAAAEREACAAIADKQMPVPEEDAPNHWEAYRKMWSLRAKVATTISEAIRARGEKGQS